MPRRLIKQQSRATFFNQVPTHVQSSKVEENAVYGNEACGLPLYQDHFCVLDVAYTSQINRRQMIQCTYLVEGMTDVLETGIDRAAVAWLHLPWKSCFSSMRYDYEVEWKTGGSERPLTRSVSCVLYDPGKRVLWYWRAAPQL